MNPRLRSRPAPAASRTSSCAAAALTGKWCATRRRPPAARRFELLAERAASSPRRTPPRRAAELEGRVIELWRTRKAACAPCYRWRAKALTRTRCAWTRAAWTAPPLRRPGRALLPHPAWPLGFRRPRSAPASCWKALALDRQGSRPDLTASSCSTAAAPRRRGPHLERHGRCRATATTWPTSAAPRKRARCWRRRALRVDQAPTRTRKPRPPSRRSKRRSSPCSAAMRRTIDRPRPGLPISSCPRGGRSARRAARAVRR